VSGYEFIVSRDGNGVELSMLVEARHQRVKTANLLSNSFADDNCIERNLHECISLRPIQIPETDYRFAKWLVDIKEKQFEVIKWLGYCAALREKECVDAHCRGKNDEQPARRKKATA